MTARKSESAKKPPTPRKPPVPGNSAKSAAARAGELGDKELNDVTGGWGVGRG